MTIKKLGFSFVGLGILGVFLFWLVDYLPGGKPGIQSAQILGIEVSIAVLLFGVWFIMAGSDNDFAAWQPIANIRGFFIKAPVFAWVLTGFFIVYVLFFVSPMFLNSTLRMEYFYRYLPDRFPIGNDLIAVLDLMKAWFGASQSPYTVQFYPPFTYVFFAPLLLIDDYPTLFKLFTAFGLISYCFLTLILPLRTTDKRDIPLVVLLFASGLVSYGFQFELERGQYNVFTFLLCLWAIYIFHYHPKYRIFAYLLFSISIQLKLYPAIFIVMFVDNWKNWKAILLRFAGIGIFNFLLLFIMGYQIFLDFLNSVSVQLSTPGWSWNGNHSIKAFMFNLTKDGYGIIGADALEMLRRNSDRLSMLFLAVFFLLLGSAILISHWKSRSGLDPYLLITCMIGALIIPISNDYTLSILTAPLAIFLSSITDMKKPMHKLISGILILGIAVAYASVLIPFKYKPYFLNNAFPPLFLIGIFVTILNWMRYRNPDTASTIQ